MRIIDERKITQTELFQLGDVMEYRIYIPQAYNNPLSYLKRGCPVWLEIDETGDCIVFEIDDENTWKKELECYITDNL